MIINTYFILNNLKKVKDINLLKSHFNIFTKKDEEIMRDIYNRQIVKPIDEDIKDYTCGEFLSYEEKVNRYKKDKEIIDYEMEYIFRRCVENKLGFKDINVSYDDFPLMKLKEHYHILTTVIGETPIENADSIKEEVESLYLKLKETLNTFNAEYEKISKEDSGNKSFYINHCGKIVYLIHTLRYKVEYYEYLYMCLDTYKPTIEMIKGIEINIKSQKRKNKELI